MLNFEEKKRNLLEVPFFSYLCPWIKTMMSVLDYMGVRGWRCVDTYYISDGKSSRVIHYLLEKWVSTDEEKLSGLQLQKADDEPVERGKNVDDLY